MKTPHFFERIRAAQNLSKAFERGQTLQKKDLAALGLPEDFKRNFKR